MDEKKEQDKKAAEAAMQAEGAPEIADVVDGDEDAEAEAVVGENAKLQEDLEAALAQVEKEKKEYLFLMAEFDNYRKRVNKEKADLIKNAGEKVLLGILPIVDDFERGLAAADKSEDAQAIRQGMEMIYTKLVKYLESQGVKAMDTNGADFNADLHDAIATIPAPSDDLKGKVVDTTQKGYMLNDKVLRHAKVAVGE